MSLKTIVKVGNINNLGEARYCAGMGVEMLGFCLDSHLSDFIDQKKFEGITQWVEGVKMVGEFTRIPDEDFDLSAYKLDYAQIQEVEHIKYFKSKGISIIFCLDIAYSLTKFVNIFKKYSTQIDYFLLKTKLPFPPFFLEELKSFASTYPILFAFNAQTQSLEQILETGVRGISLEGSEEISVGMNDFEDLANVLEQLEN